MTQTVPHILLANVFFAPFSYGGATVVAEEVARSLVRRGAAKVSAVSLMSRAELAPYTVIRSHVGGIDNYLINMPAGRSPQAFWDNPEVEAVLDDLMGQLSPDLLHAHCIQEIGIGLLRAADRRQVPTILSVHDFWWICERQFMVRMDNVYCGQNPVRVEACKGCVGDINATRSRFEALTEAAQMAQIVTYPSRFALELCEASNLAPGHGVVWENGVHLPGPGFAAAQAARRTRDPRTVFGFVGGPSQIKGWPIIRAAFKGLERADFRVDLVDGSRDGEWWRGHSFADLPGEWRVLPRFEQTDMDQFYAGIDVLLFMSQWKETFGLAIREALARGIHVIQTDSGGTTEHGAVDPARLIPIGAGPQALQTQLEEAILKGHQDLPTTRDVTGFDDQARALEHEISKLVAPGPAVSTS
ncbi:glycosyltransferase [Roseovarius sp. 2305UL8-3]|uniref:glycosyltransferase n=1 Tax=Roseovarius conchicola TaxID=3121636 RepID=UPI003526E167